MFIITDAPEKGGVACDAQNNRPRKIQEEIKMVKEITITCPFCGKTHDYKTGCHTEEQATAWIRLMTDYAEALCSCKEELASPSAILTDEEAALRYKMAQFRRGSGLYFVTNAYHSFTYEFTMPNRSKEYLSIRFEFNFEPTGVTTLLSIPYVATGCHGEGCRDVYYPEWESFSFFKEIETSSLTRENIDKMAIECYRQFIEAGGKNERND